MPAPFPASRAITGTTRLFAVIGDPIGQVQAPTLLNPLFGELGLDAVLVPVHARPAEFATVLRGLQRVENLDGILITIPHKAAAAELADECSAAAIVSGSANALRRGEGGRWRADNFDGAGFVRGLESAGHPVAGLRVSLMGAGGAGSAIAAALLAAGSAQVAIHDPDRRKRADLLDRLDRARVGEGWPGHAVDADEPVLTGVDLAINATPLGLRPEDPLPFTPHPLPPTCIVADIIMKPPETALLRTAATLGLRTHPGIHMLAYQLDFYRDFFRLAPSEQPA